MNRRLANVEDNTDSIDKKIGALTVLVKSVQEIVQQLSQNAPVAQVPTSLSGTPVNVSRPGGVQYKPKGLYDDKMTKFVPHIEIVFSSQQLARCLFNSFAAQVLDLSTDTGISPAGLDNILGGVLFALGKTDRKEEYKKGSGPMTSKIRRRTLTLALLHGQRNTYKIFRDEENFETAAAEDEDIAVTQPTWLKKRVAGGKPYVEPVHTELAQKRHEAVSGDKSAFHKRMRIVHGGQPSRDEEGEFAMSTGYSLLLGHLNQARKYAPSEFWYVVGHLFVYWNPYKTVTVDSSKVRLSWIGRMDSAAAVHIADIPRTVPSSANDPDGDETNAVRFKQFARSHEELSMIVEHDVLVNTQGKDQTMRHRIGKDVRSWRRIINLMDAAAYIIKSLCNFDKSVSIFQMLAYHTQSIAAVYAVARVLRQLFSTREAREVSESAGRHDDDEKSGCVPESSVQMSMEERIALDSIFDRMKLTRGLLERVLERALCRVSEETYDAENIPEDSDLSGREVEGKDDDEPGQDACSDTMFDTIEM